ncbi:MAG: TetR/AcrR family transcriptional regulator [Bacillus sp. (in: firmicutes)]
MARSKRDDIMEAALILFAERGYDGTTVPMIAEKAKVGAGTIYRYFENKESLVNALFQDHVTKFSEMLRNCIDENSDDIRHQFHLLFQQMVQFAKRNEFSLQFIDSHACNHYLDEKSNQIFDEFLGFLHSFAVKGSDEGVLCSLHPDAIIAIVYGAFSHLYKLIRLGKIEESEQLIQQVEDCCWNAIRIY